MSQNQCKKCGMVFKTIGHLRDHKKIHGDRTFECLEPQCSKKFVNEQAMKRHLKHHSGEKFKCETCEKVYSSKIALRAHERSHSTEKRFVCESCGAAFNFSESYKIHLRQHAQIRPYSCSKCGKTFLSRSVCRKHVKNVHKDLEEYEGQLTLSATPKQIK